MSLHCRITSIYKEVIKISGPCLSFCSPNTPDRILGSSLILQKINFSICCRWLIVQRYTFTCRPNCLWSGRSINCAESVRPKVLFAISCPQPLTTHFNTKKSFPKRKWTLSKFFWQKYPFCQVWNFCQRCKFLHFYAFFVFFPLKLLKLGEIDGVKFLAWKIRQCKFLDKFHVYICLC